MLNVDTAVLITPKFKASELLVAATMLTRLICDEMFIFSYYIHTIFQLDIFNHQQHYQNTVKNKQLNYHQNSVFIPPSFCQKSPVPFSIREPITGPLNFLMRAHCSLLAQGKI